MGVFFLNTVYITASMYNLWTTNVNEGNPSVFRLSLTVMPLFTAPSNEMLRHTVQIIFGMKIHDTAISTQNFEFMYYERKLCLLHNMLVCNNSIICCMMPMYMQSNEYIQLCERCNISAQQTITSIKCHLFKKFVVGLASFAFVSL